MQVKFRVHGVSNGMANARTEVEGETITAQIPCLEVELVTESERHGNMTLRFVGQSMEDAKGLFKNDALIVGDFKAA